MKARNGAPALTAPPCLEKAKELFYVTHPKVVKALLGPFLSHADADRGREVMRSADAVVTTRVINCLDDLTYAHAVNNGKIIRAFSGSSRREAL